MKNLLYIGNKLSGKGSNITVIESLGNSLSTEGYTMYYASEKQNPLFRLFDMIWKTIVLRNKVDFVLIDTYSTSGFWFAFIVSQLCRFFGKKYIPILHGGNLPIRLKNNPRLSKLVFENAYKNVAPSNYLFEAFQEFGLNNLVFIPNTLEIKKYTFKERNNFQARLLWVRAFDVIYNPIMAIEVMTLLQKNHPNAQLCMVGPDKDGSMEICKKIAAEKKCDVVFTNRLTKEQWIALSEEYDIFINTTHLDNTPVSVMEAMALGLPVVSTNVGGIPFLIENGKNGLLINDNDAVAMAKALELLISNPEMAQTIAVNAREKAITWDWLEIRKQWKLLLK